MPVTKAKKKTKKVKSVSFSSLVGDSERSLIDRHGDDCGAILYSAFRMPSIVLALNDDAPRNITLATWQKWGKQANAYKREMSALLKSFKKKKAKPKAQPKAKVKAKPKAKKKGIK